MRDLTRDPDAELMREDIVIEPSEDRMATIMSAVPFVIGSEYVNEDWIIHQYRMFCEVYATEIEQSKGIERKGLILAALTKLKQICNHPDQYTGQEEYLPKDSGKFEVLRDICETIAQKRERVIVFTQFKEIIPYLDEYLADIFGRQGLSFHGSTPVKTRQKLVEKFQGEDYVPYIVISVKAGGTGLNLTAANHVIHFDRWWNPAVENQATDRAFRIGQDKKVMVYKLVCRGTIEERIDAMITDKMALADSVIGSSSGENWITDMNNEDPLLFFTLRGIDVDRFVGVALNSRIERMIENSDIKSERIIQADVIESVFGFSLS